MKKLTIALIISMFSIYSRAQITFEKGYFIKNTGEKIECLIKNMDWKNNPSDFQYKISQNSEPITLTLRSVSEFAISGQSKFIKSSVNIDKSIVDFNNLSPNKNPELIEEVLFLKVLVEGEATLYSYENGILKRYFYKIIDSEIEQLFYKPYLTSNNKLAENNQYKQQLFNNLTCENISLNMAENLTYKKNSLVKFFIKYNECRNVAFTNFEKKQKGDTFNLTIRPGIKIASLKADNSGSNARDTNFDSEIGLRFGAEAEFILPFNNNKWSIFIEPTYQDYKSEKEIAFELANAEGRTLNVIVDYSSIEIPLGIRHYSFIDDKSKLFFDLAIVFDFPLPSELYAEDRRDVMDFDISSRNNLAFGAGYKYNNYSISLRYGLNRNILSGYASWYTDYNSISLILGYSLF